MKYNLRLTEVYDEVTREWQGETKTAVARMRGGMEDEDWSIIYQREDDELEEAESVAGSGAVPI
jgi:hypothetical protein